MPLRYIDSCSYSIVSRSGEKYSTPSDSSHTLDTSDSRCDDRHTLFIITLYFHNYRFLSKKLSVYASLTLFYSERNISFPNGWFRKFLSLFCACDFLPDLFSRDQASLWATTSAERSVLWSFRGRLASDRTDLLLTRLRFLSG